MTITEGRRCALPGCYVVIEPEPDGRPQRKYCTAAHRAVARQMRREGTHRSATAPPLPIPAPTPPEPVAVPAASRRRRDIAVAAVRRCRAAAVLGSAGLLVTGGGLMAASSPAGMPTAASATPWNAADPDSQQKWAGRAQITLASLDTQISQIDRAQQAWNALPQWRKYAPLPTPVHNLQQQRQLLLTQRTALQTEISVYQQAQQTGRHLADTEDGLAAIQNTLDQGGSQTPSPAQAQTIQLLRQEQQQQEEQRDAQRAQLASLHNDLQRTMALPLPQDDNLTRSVTEQVTNLVAHPELDRPSRQPDHGNARPTSPEVTAPREQDAPEADQVGNGAPPNPGRVRPEVPPGPQVLADGPQPLPDVATSPVNGAVKQVGGTLGGVTQALPRVPAAPAPALVPAPALPAPAFAAAGPSGPTHGGVIGDTLGGVTQALPRVGPQAPPPAVPAPAPAARTPGPGHLPDLAPGPRSGGDLGNTLGNAGRSLGDTAGSLTQPLNVTPVPSTPRAPSTRPRTPGNPGGALLDSPTLPLNLAAGPSVPSGGGAGHQTGPAALSGNNGGFDQTVSPPISRVAESTPDSSTSSHSDSHGAWDIPEQSTPAPSVHLPTTPAYTPDSGSHNSSSEDKARAAGEIAGSVLGGDMGDLVSSAVRAKQAQDGTSDSHSSDSGWGSGSLDRNSGSGDGDYSDLRDSIMQDYGLGSDSDSHSSDDDSRSSDDGWAALANSSADHGRSDGDSAEHGSSDVDGIIDQYTGGSDEHGSDSHDSDSHDSDSHDSDSADSDSDGWAGMAASYSDSHDSHSHDSDDDSHSSRDDDSDDYSSDDYSSDDYSSFGGSSHDSDSRDSDSRDSDSRDSDSDDDSYSDGDSHDSDDSHDSYSSDSDSHDDSDSGGDDDSYSSDSDSGGDDSYSDSDSGGDDD